MSGRFDDGEDEGSDEVAENAENLKGTGEDVAMDEPVDESGEDPVDEPVQGSDDRDEPVFGFSGVPPAWFIPVEFVEVAFTLPSTHPVLVLAEVDAPHRELRIPIGVAEGSAIAYAAREIPTPRPLTHEFVTAVIEAFDVTLETVRITDVVGTAFGAEAVFSSPVGMRTIRCRPSDGVCLAMRQRIRPPITVAGDVLEEVGYPAERATP